MDTFDHFKGASQFCHLVYHGKCLYVVLTNVYKEWCMGFYYKNDNESYTF